MASAQLGEARGPFSRTPELFAAVASSSFTRFVARIPGKGLSPDWGFFQLSLTPPHNWTEFSWLPLNFYARLLDSSQSVKFRSLCNISVVCHSSLKPLCSVRAEGLFSVGGSDSDCSNLIYALKLARVLTPWRTWLFLYFDVFWNCSYRSHLRNNSHIHQLSYCLFFIYPFTCQYMHMIQGCWNWLAIVQVTAVIYIFHGYFLKS